MPVQYKLPQRKTSVGRFPVKRTLVDRMAALYKSVRMKHGTTALDIIVPSNRNTTTPSTSGTFQSNTTTTPNSDTTQCNTTTTSNSGATQCNTTKPLNKGKAQQNMTTQTDNNEPNKKAISASQFYVNPQWMFPTSSLPRTSSNNSKKPIPPPRSKPPAPPYICPPPYVEPSDMSQTSKYTKSSQCPPYRYPCSSPPYTTQSSSLTYMSQSPTKPYMSQTYILSTRILTPLYRAKFPTLTDSTLSSVPFYKPQSSSLTITSQTPKTLNTSQMSMRFKRSQSSSVPSYKSKYPTPTDSTLSSVPFHTPQSSSLTITSQTPKTLNTSQMSMRFKRSQSSSVPSYKPKYPTPTDNTSTSVPFHTSQRSSLTNTSQTSISSLKSQFSTPSHSLPNSTSSGSSQSSAPILISQPSSSQSHTSQSSTSTNDFTSPSARLTPRSAHYIASSSFSHYTFPRAAHYNTPDSSTRRTVMPQSSTENTYPLSVCESTRNVWPTEMGSVIQVSMQNIWEVLASQVHDTCTSLQNPSKQSTPKSSDENASLPPTVSQQEKNKLNVDPESSDSKTSASKSCDSNTNDYPVVDLLPLYIHGIERKDALEEYIKTELERAWIYFNKMEVVDIKSIGEIKCICPTIEYEDMLKSPLDEKFMIANMSRQYRANNLLFETKYNYNGPPKKTIVAENMEEPILKWLITKKLQTHYWFFKTLSFFEIQNINPSNIEKFIKRSKVDKIIVMADQLEMCCSLKKIKERPVSLLAILIYLRENKVDPELFAKVVIPFIVEILQFPVADERCIPGDILNQYVIVIWQHLLLEIMKLYKVDDTTDADSTTSNLAKQLTYEHTQTDIEILKRLVPT
ncbi:unnamed protein product [Aphis gossypii]|uniref:Uncharacterized protein n=1 Tax=Aphis gossypii TaxID=80765 RepID=A0A9P0J917_APHGO|nr:unnamed protein product [Aphis gossypii]